MMTEAEKMSVSGIMCVWEEEKVSPLAIKAVAPYIDELVVVNKLGRDNTEQAIRDSCREHGLSLKFTNSDMRLRDARLYAFKQAIGDWCLIVDGDEVYHTDGKHGVHTLDKLIEVAPIDGCVYRAPMNYLYLDFKHTRTSQPQMAPHKFLYKNNESVVSAGLRDLPHYRGVHFNLNKVYKFNCGIKDADRLLMRRRYWLTWSKKYDGDLGFYEWVESNTDYKVGEKDYSELYNADDVALYDEEKWGVIPEVLRGAST